VANVIVLAKDDRVRRQIELYLNELDVLDLHFATFRTQEEFKELYFRDLMKESPPAPEENGTPAPPPELPPEDQGAELKLFSEVNMFIFALDTIEGRLFSWIDSIRSGMKKFKHFPATGGMRMILLKYEDDGISKLDVMHPHLDDLVYLPLDRLVFLQKLQIFAEYPKRVSPSYLFNQEVSKRIEISKLTKLDRLSDVALAVRNPVPLKKGLPGHFYVTFPGEKTRIEIYGKVLRSEPHPEYPKEFLVYFSYFGLSRASLTAIRRTLSKSPVYKSLLFDDRDRFRFRPDDLFLDDSTRHIFGTMVIDSDETTGNSLSQVLSKEMDRLNVVTESSYSLFLHRYLESGAGVHEKLPPKATETSDFFASKVSLTVTPNEMKCLTVDPGPTDRSLFLGHPALELFSSPDRWLSLITEQESRLILEESVHLAANGRTLDKLLCVQDLQGQRCAVNFHFYRGQAEGTVNIDLTTASLGDIVTKMSSEKKSKEIEAMIVDTNFIPDDPRAWVEGIRQRAAHVGLVTDPAQLKFWLVQEGDGVAEKFLNTPDFLGLFTKPVDQRQLLFSMSENLPNKNTIYQFENLGWTSPTMSVHIAKEIDLEALSEYGATLSAKQKLVPGTIIFLRKSIYENAPNGCLAARVYACEEHPKDKALFQIFTTYYGINDAFLKFARTWIRENYALQKAQG
jgi:hypothetical protein